jgi:hypothetical protein
MEPSRPSSFTQMIVDIPLLILSLIDCKKFMLVLNSPVKSYEEINCDITVEHS